MTAEFGPFPGIEPEYPRPFDITQEAIHGLAHGGFVVEPDQLAGCTIGVGNMGLAIKDNNPLLDGLENGFQESLFLGQTEEMGLNTFRIQPIQAGNQFIKKSCFHGSFCRRDNVSQTIAKEIREFKDGKAFFVVPSFQFPDDGE
jgi:hypothetical protein